MLEEIDWSIDNDEIEDDNFVFRDKIYLLVPIDKEGKMGLNLTIIRPTIKKIMRRIFKFYDSEIDKNLKERMNLNGKKWRDLMGKKVKFGGIKRKAFDIFELELYE